MQDLANESRFKRGLAKPQFKIRKPGKEEQRRGEGGAGRPSKPPARERKKKDQEATP